MERRGSIRPNIVFEIAKKVSTALKAVHDAGRTYNDLKPSNIMIEDAEHEIPRVYLIDFGLSKEINVSKKAKVDFEGNILFSSLS